MRRGISQIIRAQIEGDALFFELILEALPLSETEIVGIGPYLCIVDEYAAPISAVTPGFEVVITKIWSRRWPWHYRPIHLYDASQDYAGILEADKKGAQQMVANTSIKVFMKNQYSNFTGLFCIRNLFVFSRLTHTVIQYCPMKMYAVRLE